jgi:hypothetical protein
VSMRTAADSRDTSPTSGPPRAVGVPTTPGSSGTPGTPGTSRISPMPRPPQ